MTAKSRFNAVGTSGRTGVPSDALSENRGDYFTKTLSFTPTIVASAAAQDTGIVFPAGAVVTKVIINIFTAESTGITKTLDVGFVAGLDTALVSGASVAVAAMIDGGTITDPNQSGNTISYTLGSADFVELDCEVVIEFIGSDV